MQWYFWGDIPPYMDSPFLFLFLIGVTFMFQGKKLLVVGLRGEAFWLPWTPHFLRERSREPTALISILLCKHKLWVATGGGGGGAQTLLQEKRPRTLSDSWRRPTISIKQWQYFRVGMAEMNDNKSFQSRDAPWWKLNQNWGNTKNEQFNAICVRSDLFPNEFSLTGSNRMLPATALRCHSCCHNVSCWVSFYSSQ